MIAWLLQDVPTLLEVCLILMVSKSVSQWQAGLKCLHCRTIVYMCSVCTHVVWQHVLCAFDAFVGSYARAMMPSCMCEVDTICNTVDTFWDSS